MNSQNDFILLDYFFVFIKFILLVHFSLLLIVSIYKSQWVNYPFPLDHLQQDKQWVHFYDSVICILIELYIPKFLVNILTLFFICFVYLPFGNLISNNY